MQQYGEIPNYTPPAARAIQIRREGPTRDVSSRPSEHIQVRHTHRLCPKRHGHQLMFNKNPEVVCNLRRGLMHKPVLRRPRYRSAAVYYLGR